MEIVSDKFSRKGERANKVGGMCPQGISFRLVFFSSGVAVKRFGVQITQFQNFPIGQFSWKGFEVQCFP